ncbi:beta-ketoacyl synthase N-terminal-like domain-containing protein [Amycolatopsis sp. NPDC059027]|uniref:type I polyketide synthase n=1 Tax=Amycolatopsis sp. NPDC059027 TaxID=3346709 RepID=UPI00366FFA6A
MRDPIAIIGIGCRFPGAQGLDGLWRLLESEVDAIEEIPASRFDVGAVYDPQPATPGKTVSRYGGFLDDIDRFDAAYFGISPREAAHLDPQQRLLLETAADALHDAGLTAERLAGGRAGVFVGQLTTNYWEHLSRRGILDIYANLGTARSSQSGRLSHAFDLRGPSVSVDTACSSGLVAVHLACQSLRSGESEVALAAGVNVILSADEGITFSQANMLSPDGRCKFGAAAADGFVRSEGVGVVVLKPLSRALADGDPVHALVLGSAVRNDGESGGSMMTPAEEGQVETLRAAYADAGVDPAEVGYVEAHGTGTPVGDPVELRAMARVFGDSRRLPVGSVKTNIGHAESAAGIAGLVKAVLCLRHRRIPASLHAGALTPAVDWSTLPVEIVREARPWPSSGRAIAGVTSIGISGTSAHCVVAEHVPDPVPPETEPRASRLLALSARSRPALLDLAMSSVDYLETGSGAALADICFTAGACRDHHEHRMTVVGASRGEMAEKLRAFVDGRPARGAGIGEATGTPRIVFVFPGQGSQWSGMARELLRSAPAFAAALAECDAAVRAEAGWSPIELLTDGGLTGIAYVQPTLWAVEVALAAQWRFWGVLPDAVVGHSMGEVAAACVAGSLSLADGAAVICRRSAVLAGVAGKGAMASVELTVEQAEAEIAPCSDRVSVAVSNSESSTVLAGDPVTLDEVLARLDEREIFHRKIKVDVASHSPQMDALRPELLTAITGMEPAPGDVRMVSTVDGTDLGGTELTADYWARNLREPVRFGAVTRALAEEAPTIFVEMSPHPLLVSAVRETLDAVGSGAVVASTRRDEPELATLLDSLGAVHRAGGRVDWAAVCPGRTVRLPGYPWQRERHWYIEESAPVAHPLLRGFTKTADGRWEGRIDLSVNAYLTGHQVQDTVVLPGTAYAELVLAAAKGPVELCDITYHRAIYLDAEPQLGLEVADGRFIVSSRSGESTWDTCASGSVHTVPASRPRMAPAELHGGATEHLSGEQFYERFTASGNQWLGSFRGIADLWRRDDEAVAKIEIPSSIVDTIGTHVFHPAVLDACGQVLAATVDAAEHAGHGATFVLGGIDALRVHERPRGTVWSHAIRTRDERDDSFTGDVTVTDEDGKVLAEFTGLRLQYLDPVPEAEPADLFHEVCWRRVPAPEPVESSGYWVVFADGAGVGADLAARLGSRVAIVLPGEEFRVEAPGRYRIDPDAEADYQAVFRSVRGENPGVTCRGVVYLWSLDASGPDDVAACRRVPHLARSLDGHAGLWLVTRGAHRIGGDRVVRQEQTALWGLGRTLAREQRDRRVLVDLPEDAPVDLTREIRAADDGENQIALRADGRYVARLVRGVPEAVSGPSEIRPSAPGLLDELAPRPAFAVDPGHGEVLIRVGHTGVNYRDVLMATGTYPGQGAEIELGWECAGTVAEIGPGVAGLSIGDSVVAATGSAMGTHVLADARLVLPMPARLTEAEAATLPIAYLTAYYGLQVLGRLREGERVLVHSATGGVGIAAVRYAQWKGAEVFATAGSTGKRALLRTLGVRHVSDSRSVDFADDVLAATRGRGVDVVLNTLTGPAIEANLRALAPYGRYVDISKRDVIGNTPVGLGPFGKNLTYSAFDVTDLLRERPEEAAAALEHVLGLVDAGLLDPLPHETYPATDAAAAFRRMASARHTGKLVLDFTGVQTGQTEIRPDATYIVTGGQGGLGRVVCEWLLDNGATHVLSLGRSAVADTGDPRIVHEQADVADEAALRAVLRRREEAGLPVPRGVVHAAGAVDYAALDEVTPAKFADVLRPKVAGGWALHRVLLGRSLDFFVLFSSGSSILGSPRLGAYAAANAFLDGLAAHRRLAGLPATSVNWGFWSGTGMVARYEREHARGLTPKGFASFGPETGMAVLGELLDRDVTQAAVLAADWPRWAAAYPEAASDPLLRELVGSVTSEPVPEPAPIAEPEPAAPVSDLTAYLAAEIAGVMGLPVDRLDLGQPLNRQGFDSLMAGQVRGKVKQGLGVLLPITRMLSGESVVELANGLREKLRESHPDGA